VTLAIIRASEDVLTLKLLLIVTLGAGGTDPDDFG
jgi:hypothetical protein